MSGAFWRPPRVFLTGYLVARLEEFSRAASSIAIVCLLGTFVLAFARETKGQKIQHLAGALGTFTNFF